jgi:5,10-methylenetetrahydromethanopterin reductase
MAAVTLDEFFPGRVQLCFGVGAPRDLAAAGIAAPNPLATLSEAIEIARTLLGGETIAFRGKRFQVAGRSLDAAPRPLPILLAASGPRTLELAGRAADGVVISAATSVEFLSWSLDQVRRGEAASARRVRKVGLIQAAVDDNGRRAHDQLRRTLGFVLRGAHHARNLAQAGTRLDQAALAAAFAREDWAEVDRLVDDDVVTRHAASGTLADVTRAIERYRGVGLDEIVLTGVSDGATLRRLVPAGGSFVS